MTQNSQLSVSSTPNAVGQPSTPLYVGPEMVIQGTVIYKGDDPKAVLMVVGKIEGNIKTTGILHVVKGAVIEAESSIECSEIVVAGKIVGKGVTIKTQSLKLESTGNVEAELVCLPPGGLEQCRGGVLNARLDMSSAHEIATESAIPAFLAASPANAVKPPPRSLGHSFDGSATGAKDGSARTAQVIALGAEFATTGTSSAEPVNTAPANS